MRKTSATTAQEKERAGKIFELLLNCYPDPVTALHWADPFQLLVATILSAQCTDARVNMVTPELFRQYPSVDAFAGAVPHDIEALTFTTGFYRNKAKSILGAARALREKHGGVVPQTLAELTALPGVGRKTASVVLGAAFGKSEGVVVDTHVARLSRRLGLTAQTEPVRIERDLMNLFHRSRWIRLSHLFIHHGRAVCVARSPRCNSCVLSSRCPSAKIDASTAFQKKKPSRP